MTGEDLEQLKRQFPLLDYLRRLPWTARRAGPRHEFVGLCPLHRETRPSFYVNARKNLFYCHGCGRGGDLIRFVELFLSLSFPDSVAHLRRELAPPPSGPPSGPADDLLAPTAAFYQLQLHRRPEAPRYLQQRGLRDPALIEELGVGYAPGGNLRRHLVAHGYSFDRLIAAGLINDQGCDAFCQRVIFPCRQHGRIVNLYGRSIGATFPHRLLPGSKGGLFAWESAGAFPTAILVEGLFDLAVLWQAGFRNATCALGTHLTPVQWAQLSDRPGRCVYIVFDSDENDAGQQAAESLAQRLASGGLIPRIVQLPDGHDPNSYFVAGATAADFTHCLNRARSLPV